MTVVGAALMWLTACGDTAPETAPGAGGGSSSSDVGGGDGLTTLMGAQLGDPLLQSAQRIDFGPGGVLLVGDGRSDRFVAIETGDTSDDKREENSFNRVDNLTGAAAKAIGDGVPSNELVVEDIAVNPTSWRTYFTVTRFSTAEAFILWIDEEGDVRLFDLSNVVHATVDVPPAEGSGSQVTGIAWTDHHVVGALTPVNLTRPEFSFIETPFAHDGRSRRATTLVFHRTVNQWLSEVTMDRFFLFSRLGEDWVAGSFSSTIARFRTSDLEDGVKDQVGETVFDLMEGRGIMDFLAYEQGGDLKVLASVSNFLFDGVPAGIRFDGELFQAALINSSAPVVFDLEGNILVEGVERVHNLNEVQRLALRGDEVVVLRSNKLQAEAVVTASF